MLKFNAGISDQWVGDLIESAGSFRDFDPSAKALIYVRTSYLLPKFNEGKHAQ